MPFPDPPRDPLTSVYSRASLEERLEQEFERAQRYQLPFSLLLMDIDHFKSVNDAFGHRYGDRVLIEFSQRLQRLCRSSDLVLR